MALCNFWSRVSVFLYLTIPLAAPLSFKFPTIKPHDMNINVTGDAYISSQGLQLTSNESNKAAAVWATGRATYIKPLHLWDKASGNLTDFYTHFSFVIDASANATDGACSGGDGFAFFLAPFGSSITGDSSGSGLGLVHRDSPEKKSGDPFVAVEFDTFKNGWDPEGLHVGIDINSLISVTNVTWSNNITEGKENEAWISYNSASKNLSVNFTGHMSNLTQNGRLSYTVDLTIYLPERVSVGFSAATGLCLEKHNVKSWEFNSMVTNNQGPINTDPSMVPNISPQPSYPVSLGGKKTKGGLVIGLIVGPSVLVPVLVLIGYSIWRYKNRKGKIDELSLDITMDAEFERECGPKKFSYGELVRATDNFADEKMLGGGGFGWVYLGYLRDSNSYVAVKRVSKDSKQGMREYASEVKIISRLRHRNLVQLLGWCHEQRELLLVYELLPNGSLDLHLFKGKSLLTWETRYKIARGLASALLYLHEEWEQCVVHRDIKSSNIMLDSSFNAKLGDFGLARLVDHEKGSQTTVLAGTMGYMAPEYLISGKASKESDVYSFGVVALEIACGRKPIDVKAQENQVSMVEWVWDLYGTRDLLKAADPKLCADYNEQEIECLMIVGLWCAHPDISQRPSIKEAIHVLNFEAQLPLLPSKLPVLTYFAPPHIVTISSVSQSGNVSLLQPSSYRSDVSNSTSPSAPSAYASASTSAFTSTSASASPSASAFTSASALQ
ncbi:L-type lectin-domain containing receptor kinase -like [Olea europaea subsp. europaea]|uniref:non-specific serine/threonine protein kinase n=1 Tax=Olea europaea subsp. europaea TaxID=158383 RepID=A0A8S0UKL8_OLEEU|nr:L-type lectin-domain containing receptor kinase -like [Olea europaea subsp. europaea]CAA3020741.1 L-type lectin-domain containing receptor kinase -like [Olea europaea subsp. europaea]